MLENLQQFHLSRSAITRLFVAAIACFVAGWVLGFAVVVTTLASGAIAIGGPQLITVDPGPIPGAIAGIVLASLLTAIGATAGFAAKAAALRNTWSLEDKSWFYGMAGLTVVDFGWLALVAYILRGPDGTAAPDRAA